MSGNHNDAHHCFVFDHLITFLNHIDIKETRAGSQSFYREGLFSVYSVRSFYLWGPSRDSGLWYQFKAKSSHVIPESGIRFPHHWRIFDFDVHNRCERSERHGHAVVFIRVEESFLRKLF